MAQKSDKILVIRLSAMGDCAMAVPVLLRLIKTYPQLQIQIITKSFFKPIFEVLPDDVEILVADTKGKHKGFLGLLGLAKELNQKHFTQVADLHNVLRSKIIRSILKLSGAKTAAIDKGRTEKKELTRTKNKIFRALKTTPQRYADVFEELGYPIDLTAVAQLPKPPFSAHFKAFMASGSSLKYIGIAPFAAHQPKTYPSDLMKEVLRGLSKNPDYRILLFGGGKKETTELEALSKEFPHTVSVAGKLSFKDEIAIMAYLDAMIAMDSGNGHLAALYNVPVITLWGGTHPHAGFAPFGQPPENQILPDLQKYPLLPTSVFGNKQLEGYEEAMRSISPHKILDRIKSILD